MPEQLENLRIDQLPRNAVLKSHYVFPIRNLDTQQTEQVELSEILTSSTTQNFEWVTDNDPGYMTNEVVTYGGRWWQSLIDNNLNIVPGSDPTKWAEVAKSPSGFVFWQPGVYPQDEVFVLYPSTGDIQIYHLVNPTRPFLSSDFDAELAAGDWEIISGGASDGHFKGTFANEAALIAAYPTAEPGDYALVDTGGVDAMLYIWDETDSAWVASGITTIVPDASETVKGIVQEATQTEVDNKTAVGSSGARLFVNPEKLSEGTGTGLFGRGYWQFGLATTPPPASGFFRLNNATMLSVTEIYLHEVSANSEDISNFLGVLKTGDIFYIQQRNDATRWLRATVNGALVDNGVYWTIPVVVNAASTPLILSNAFTLIRVTIATEQTPNASETVKGIVEEATLAQVMAGTAVGETGAPLYVNPAKLLASHSVMIDLGTVTGAVSLDLSLGSRFTAIFSGNVTLTFINEILGREYSLDITRTTNTTLTLTAGKFRTPLGMGITLSNPTTNGVGTTNDKLSFHCAVAGRLDVAITPDLINN